MRSKTPTMVTTKCVIKKVDLLENALYAVPSVEGYAIRCVLFNTIIIPNVWASPNINMSHIYIALIQLHVIYFNQHPPVYMVTWLTSFTVVLLDRAVCSQHAYESAELRIIQRFETSQNTVRFCLFSRWNG